MKRRTLSYYWGSLALFLLSPALVRAGAISETVFTYQGQLLVNSVAVTGNFDMQFKLHPSAVTTNQIGPTVVVSPVGVTNGLFTVGLDFGNVYGTPPIYLEIDVRTYGSTSNYTALSPAQVINPTPYAINAENSASFTGAVSDSQLSANVALFNTGGGFSGPVSFTNASGKFSGTFSGTFNGTNTGTFSGTATGNFSGTNSGTFIGNGAGITNVNVTNIVGVVQSNPNWQVMQSTSQTAVAGNNYLTTNSALATLTLPGSPNVGSIIRFSGSGANGWTLLPNTGQTIITANLGLPGGQTWTQQATSLGALSWHAVCSSANGLRLAAGVGVNSTGSIYYSTDGGRTWHQSDAPAKSWTGIACSSDGTRMVAVPNGGNIYTSINGGTNWVAQTGSTITSYTCAASSADGINLVAGVGSGSGPIYTSNNGGTNWTARSFSSQNWQGVACSSDGTKIVGVASGAAQIWVSANSGVSWTNAGPTTSWSAVACSADGAKMVATVNTGNIYTSGDGGLTWIARASSQSWKTVTSSADGTALAAAYSLGNIYTSSDSGQTWIVRTNDLAANQAWACITSSANGSRLLAGVSTGYLYTSAATTSSLSGTQFSSIELQYIGNNLWMPLTYNGAFTGN